MCLIAAVIELDNVSFGQFGFARPFMCGIIFGFIMGDVSAGVQLGIFIELLFVDFTPVGGVLPPNGTVAALCAVMAACYGAPLYFAFFYGVAVGLLFRFIEMRLRGFTARRMLARQTDLNNNPVKIVNTFVFGSMLFQVAITFGVMLAAVLAAKTFLYYAKPVGANMHVAFNAAYLAAPWLGVFALLRKFSVRVQA
jgi:PTS system mannose-specific IIC component